MGVALIGLGRFEEAAATIQCAVDLFPDFPNALADLGDCLATLGRTKEAERAYKRGLQIALPGEEARMRIISGLERL